MVSRQTLRNALLGRDVAIAYAITVANRVESRATFAPCIHHDA